VLDRTAEQFDVQPSRLVADAGYGSAEMLGWLVDKRDEPHVKVFDNSERKDGTFSRSDFAYDAESRPRCMPRRQGVNDLPSRFRHAARRRDESGAIRYRASKFDCEACALKPTCCPNAVARKIARSIYKAARDKARAVAKTAAYAIARRERKKVEMLFEHLKQCAALS
jgi:hypothetical protein